MTGIPDQTIELARQTSLLFVLDMRGVRTKKISAVERSGPCPRCGGRDRFAINTKKQVFNCRGCGAKGDVVALVQFIDGCSFAEAVERLTGGRWRPSERPAVDLVRPRTGPSQDEDDARREHDKVLWLWRQRKPIAGTIAEVYLREARGYRGVIPATLAFLPAHDDHEPALIAAFGLCSEPEPGEIAIADVRAVQLVKLRPDGRGKADCDPVKIIIGKGALGSPIVLAPPNDLLGLAICEGIEDALSIHEATGLGAWASGGAGRMPALTDAVPSYIDSVTIVADRDHAGIRGAEALAGTLSKRRMNHRISYLGEPPS